MRNGRPKFPCLSSSFFSRVTSGQGLVSLLLLFLNKHVTQLRNCAPGNIHVSDGVEWANIAY